MRTKDVRLDVELNKLVWAQGISSVPDKIRLVISRHRNEDEGAKVGRGAAAAARGAGRLRLPRPRVWALEAAGGGAGAPTAHHAARFT